MASASGASSYTHLFLLLLLLLLLFMSSISSKVAMNHETASEAMAAMKPVSGMKSVLLDGPRRRLNGFRICALCTCCGGSRGLCLPSPCCYAINCNIPNRPFGFCSLTPQTCNCFGCHL